MSVTCHCGDEDCLHFGFDYPWCRPCAEHHRSPECAVDQEGYALASCGCRWEDVERQAHRPACCYTDAGDTHRDS